jgi:hypothetical protein
VNSHATSNAYRGYDALHRIDEIRPCKKGYRSHDSHSVPAYSARHHDLLLPEKFKPLKITKYDAKQDLVQWLRCYACPLKKLVATMKRSDSTSPSL